MFSLYKFFHLVLKFLFLILMETFVVKNISLKEKVSKLTKPLEFDLEMICNKEIKEGVVFTIIYNVNLKDEKDDQILSEIEIAPIPKGTVKFSLDADPVDIDKIPHDQLFGLTSIIIIGKYKEQQFIRFGYIVDIYYPGIPNDKLTCYEEEEEFVGDENEEDEEEEDEEEEADEELDDFIVPDEVEEEEEQTEPKTFEEALEDKIAHNVHKSQDENAMMEEREEKVTEESASMIREELDKPITEKAEFKDNVSEEENEDDVFEYKGYSINKKKIEMNIMEPPSIQTFLISWIDGEDEFIQDEEENITEEEAAESEGKDISESDDNEKVKKMKTE